MLGCSCPSARSHNGYIYIYIFIYLFICLFTFIYTWEGERLKINGRLAKRSRIGERLFFGGHSHTSDQGSLKHLGASGRGFRKPSFSHGDSCPGRGKGSMVHDFQGTGCSDLEAVSHIIAILVEPVRILAHAAMIDAFCASVRGSVQERSSISQIHANIRACKPYIDYRTQFTRESPALMCSSVLLHPDRRGKV